MRAAGPLLLALLLAGCAVGPDFHRPAPPAVQAYRPGPAAIASPDGRGRLAQGADVGAQWWTAFGSPRLDALERQALAANADLAAAKATLRAAHEAWLVQRGTLLPTADASYDATREKASAALSPPLSTPQELFTLHTLTLNVAYAADVFGGLRRQIEAAGAQEEDQRFQSEAVFLTLTSSVAAGALQEASLNEQVAATRRLMQIAEQLLQILRAQKSLGEVTGADVAAQESAFAQAQQALPPLEKALAAQRDQLAALTGRLPAQDQDPPLQLAEVSLPAELPLSLPSRLVDQRPDIRAAEANLHAASAQVGVAVAARLPNITLGAQAGGASTTLASLLASPNTFWSLTGGLAQPIFEGGQLLHRQRQAQALLDEARAQYRSAVLDAFQNVADVLAALDADGRALAAAQRAEQAARTGFQIASDRVALGQSARIEALVAEQGLRQAELARTQAQGARLADAVALYQALGGGWWNRKDFAAR